MSISKFTYSIIFVLLLISSSTNFHALSHLFDNDDLDKIEHCDTCDEFISSQVEKIAITSPSVEVNSPTILVSTSVDFFLNSSIQPSLKPFGQFYNKPPPAIS